MEVLSYENAVVTVRGQTYRENGPLRSLTENIGAGIILDAQGYIVTNTHVIYGSNIVRVILPDGSEPSAQVAFISQEYDFSILKIDPNLPLSSIRWPESGSINLGDEVVTIGHSPLLHRTISGGIITGIGSRPLEDGRSSPELIQLNINHYNGDSGGPVFDTKGHFIALLNAKRNNVQRAVFAIPADKIYSAYLTLVKPPQSK